ncbi:MAG TPA: hydroxymethylbilane synthase [Propionibacteriaceae bacterium]|nr:hydroxymethylbilane synthase [Propionibacteriaceae bacterium]
MTASPRPVRIGARRSPLAVAQAEWVADRLRAAGHEAELVGIESHGDRDQRKLTEIGGTGVFAVAVREAVLDGTVDLAVHSLKDLPVAPAPGLVLVAVPAREDARDVIVGLPPDQWDDDTVIGTGSPRRELQLAALASGRGVSPRFVAVRGNVDTRVDRVRRGEVHATVLAAAGLRRLGRLDADGTQVSGVPALVLPIATLLPAAGQAALAIECRDDSPVRALAATLDDPGTRAAVTAERRFLATLEAGCLAPVGAFAEVTAGDAGKQLTLTVVTGRKGASGGVQLIADQSSAPTDEADDLGDRAARRVLAQLAG